MLGPRWYRALNAMPRSLSFIWLAKGSPLKAMSCSELLWKKADKGKKMKGQSINTGRYMDDYCIKFNKGCGSVKRKEGADSLILWSQEGGEVHVELQFIS